MVDAWTAVVVGVVIVVIDVVVAVVDFKHTCCTQTTSFNVSKCKLCLASSHHSQETAENPQL